MDRCEDYDFYKIREAPKLMCFIILKRYNLLFAIYIKLVGLRIPFSKENTPFTPLCHSFVRRGSVT